jgi:GT2 family glycosyltransferase
MDPADELIVVDSASIDAIAVADIAANSDAVYVRAERPGVNRARNLGRAHARHALIVHVDDDVVVDTGWADAIASCAAAHPEAAFITGRLSPLNEAKHGNVAVKDDAEPAHLTTSTRGDLGHGANLLVRAEALEAVGGWDEALGAGARFTSAPEADLFDRLFAAGMTGRYEPEARGWHEQWRTSGQLVRLDWRYGFGNGARLAKLVRNDRSRARQIGAEAAWGWGLRQLVAAARQGNKTEAARVAARLVGTVAGFGRAVSTPVHNGHFVDQLRPKTTK